MPRAATTSGSAGPYTVAIGRCQDGTEPLTVEVKNEAEIVRDLALQGPVRETYFSGVVLEKNAHRRPARRRGIGLPLARCQLSSQADDQGRFQMERTPGE